MANLLTIKESAIYLHVSQRTVERFLEEGKIPKIKLASRTLRIDAKDLEKFIQSKKKEIDITHFERIDEETRNKVRKRDNFACQKCKVQASEFPYTLHVHHKDLNLENNDLDNLTTLCVSCHNLMHKDIRSKNGN